MFHEPGPRILWNVIRTLNVAHMAVIFTCHTKVACEPYNLATTAGHNASTGCGGLILQGGHGFLETWSDNLLGFVFAGGVLRSLPW